MKGVEPLASTRRGDYWFNFCTIKPFKFPVYHPCHDSQHEIAFHYSCKSAVSDVETPNGWCLEFAWVKSVTSRILPRRAQRLVEEIYDGFCPGLHKAVRSLACDKDLPLDQLIVFMDMIASSSPVDKTFLRRSDDFSSQF